MFRDVLKPFLECSISDVRLVHFRCSSFSCVRSGMFREMFLRENEYDIKEYF